MTLLVVLLSCRTEILEWLWEKRILSPKEHLRTSLSCKADNNSSLRHEEVESQSWGFSVYLIGYFQDILCKQANECEFLNRKVIGTLGQMASTQLNNIYTHKVKKIWKQEKATFENIIRSAAAQIAAATLQGCESHRFKETGRFVSFPVNEIMLQWPLVQLYLLHPTSYHNSNNLRNPFLLYGGSKFKTIKVN